jgi:hypothetical protein
LMTSSGTSNPRAMLSIAAACLMAGALCHAGGDEAPTPVVGESSFGQKSPGTEGAVAGHLPSQMEQARTASVSQPLLQAEVGSVGWWPPSSDRRFEQLAAYPNDWGAVGLLNAEGGIDSKGHPFFTPLGANGRACVTCHQPADGMGLSLKTIQQRWSTTGGKDPLFASIDGSNCPSLPQGERSNHSLLVEHGLIRIYLPWPPRAADGSKVDPEFTIDVVRDPSTCNLDRLYGLHSANPMISVFRRPRAVANEHYISASFALRGVRGRRLNNKTGEPLSINPETGQRTGLPIMADGREPTLRTQAFEAVMTHEQAESPPSDDQLLQIERFENQLFVAQLSDKVGDVFSGENAPSAMGPAAVAAGRPHVSGDNWNTPIFGNFDAWDVSAPGLPAATKDFRDSVRRGYEVFTERPMWIRDVAWFNSIGMGNPYKRNCTICHATQFVGTDTSPGVMDIGANNRPWSKADGYLPLFKLTCKPSSVPHPYLGRTIYTHDPGRALITGRCQDIGSLVMQQLRGLAVRAPYFSNGSAKDLAAVVDYYNERFDMKLTDQEKKDLINFMSVL